MNMYDIFDNEVDEEWYIAQNPDVKNNLSTAKDHYIQFGRKEGRFPNRVVAQIMEVSHSVDPAWYRSEYKDVAENGVDPYLHYAFYGKAEKRHPNRRQKILAESGSGEVDELWYLDNYRDVAESGLRADEHYLMYGRAEGRAPNQNAEASMRKNTYEPFIKNVILRCAGREARSDELSHYANRLLNGMSPYDLFQQILTSPESRLYFQATGNLIEFLKDADVKGRKREA